MINDILHKAKALGACDRANQDIQSWLDLAELYFSAQGLEFCTNKNFPSLNLWRKINRKYDISEFGIFVEGKRAYSVNQPNIAVIGSEARLEYNRIGKYTIVLQHGAKAVIKASNYAVLNIIKIGECEMELEMDNTVRLL